MNKYIFVLFFFLMKLTLSAQNVTQLPDNENFKIEADLFLGRDLQQSYYFLKNRALLKKTISDQYVYQNTTLGKVTTIDFKNPLHLVLFYKNFNTIVLLDNQLNETKTIDFNLNSNGISVEAVGWSTQNKLWIYDGITSRIGLYNLENETFNWITNANLTNLKHYFTSYTHFYGVDTTNLFYSFSITGKKTTYGKIPDYENLQLLDDNKILYSFGNQLFIYDISQQKKTKITLELKNNSNYYASEGILTIFTASEIRNFKINLQ